MNRLPRDLLLHLANEWCEDWTVYCLGRTEKQMCRWLQRYYIKCSVSLSRILTTDALHSSAQVASVGVDVSHSPESDAPAADDPLVGQVFAPSSFRFGVIQHV